VQETFDKSETVEVETSQEVTSKLTISSLVENSCSVNSSVSPSVVEKYPSADLTAPNCSVHSSDDISTPTRDNVTMPPRWIHNKGHKRSQSSNAMDYSTTVVVRHRRSNSFDINLLVQKTNKPVNRMETEAVVKDGEQEEQEEEQQTSSSDLLHDEVDFTSMFGIWKGS